MWFKRLKEFLITLVFIQGWFDPSLFILSQSAPIEHTIYLFVYVDEMVVTCLNDKRLGVEFAVQQLGEFSYSLGIHVKSF